MRFKASGREVRLARIAAAPAPIIYLNAYQDPGEKLTALLDAKAAPPCTLVIISSLKWEDDLSPAPAPPAFKGGQAFSGQAAAYNRLLTECIIPQAESLLPEAPNKRMIAGYSMAGLFALYAVRHCSLFSAAASISGSLWFPGFTEDLLSTPLPPCLKKLYLSVGTKESRTRNPLLSTVQTAAEEIAAAAKAQGITCRFELNPGSHFNEPLQRTVKGLSYLLED